MCFKEDDIISTVNDKPMKLVDHFTYLGSNISSTESDVNKDYWPHGNLTSLIKWNKNSSKL